MMTAWQGSPRMKRYHPPQSPEEHLRMKRMKSPHLSPWALTTPEGEEGHSFPSGSRTGLRPLTLCHGRLWVLLFCCSSHVSYLWFDVSIHLRDSIVTMVGDTKQVDCKENLCWGVDARLEKLISEQLAQHRNLHFRGTTAQRIVSFSLNHWSEWRKRHVSAVWFVLLCPF